ncbi:MAG: c-type cytochrome [Caldilineales bacterium]|nr:c-type cytochrome [Caldilineales bacterium]MDW8319110.1 c-type cytochrome [Anaerolineae bacterium]
MRTYILLVVVLILAVGLTACGGGGGAQQQPAPAAGQAPAVKGNPEKGKQLFAQTVLAGNAGCITCHSLEPGKVLVGPSMAGIASRAGNTVPGQSAEEYLRISIVDTNAYLAKGCNVNAPEEPCAANLMPADWAQKLTPEQIDDLVAYLLTLK